MTKLSLKEQKILWAVLNQAQDIGLRDSVSKIDAMNKASNETTKLMIENWLYQTQVEYDVLNTLKSKLCGDLE
jgi:hypothetical protein